MPFRSSLLSIISVSRLAHTRHHQWFNDMTAPSSASSTQTRMMLADVDGTLVTQQKTLTDRAIEAVHRLHAAGILFDITSGRPRRGMGMLVKPLDLQSPPRRVLRPFHGDGQRRPPGEAGGAADHRHERQR